MQHSAAEDPEEGLCCGWRRSGWGRVNLATVLVVEDDADIRELEQAVLSYAGHSVLAASNGREALDVLDANTPCVIVLDLMMPVMDGLQFLSEYRARVNGTLPVICLTAAPGDWQKRAVGLGASECFQKPLDMDHLCQRVDHYCGTRASAR